MSDVIEEYVKEFDQRFPDVQCVTPGSEFHADYTTGSKSEMRDWIRTSILKAQEECRAQIVNELLLTIDLIGNDDALGVVRSMMTEVELRALKKDKDLC